MAYMVNAFYLIQLLVRSNVWFDWVPSKANIADLPSRQAYQRYFSLFPTSVWVDIVLPAIDSWSSPLDEMSMRLFSHVLA